MPATVSLFNGHVFSLSEELTAAKLNAMFSQGYGVLVGQIGTTNLALECVTVDIMADLARGSILVGGSANRPTALSAKTAGRILVGDGTDLKSVAVSGDATMTAAGVVTVENQLTEATQWNASGTITEKVVLADDDWLLLEDSADSYAKKKVRKKNTFTPPTYYKHGLVVKNNAVAPTTQVDIDATELVVQNSAGATYILKSINVTIDATGVGADGLDGGTLGAATLYYAFVIYDPTTDTIAGLLSVSASSPTLPSGYSYYRLVGEIATAGGGATFITTHRAGDEVWFGDPQQVYSNQTLTTTPVEYPLPTGVPLGAVALDIEMSRYDSAAGGTLQVVYPSSAVAYSVTGMNDCLSANQNKGQTAGFGSVCTRMKHLGAASVYARCNFNSSVAAQNLHVWGYVCER